MVVHEQGKRTEADAGSFGVTGSLLDWPLQSLIHVSNSKHSIIVFQFNAVKQKTIWCQLQPAGRFIQMCYIPLMKSMYKLLH